jgi:Ti-type conjugative transfer relaxase TraA
MLTTRSIDENGFGLKNTEWNRKTALLEWRKSWSDIANHHLAKAGHEITIDHRSHAERGIDLEPQHKIGTGFHRKDKTAIERFEDHQRIARENGARIIADPAIGLDYVTRHQAVFGEYDIYRLAHRHSADADQFKKVSDKILSSEQLVKLGVDEKGKERFTTRQVLEAEREMMGHATSMAAQTAHRVEERFIEQARATRTLTPDQDQALEHICTSGDICCVVGFAGSGKSYTLGAVREAFEAQGYKVKGAALAGIAAEGLQRESGIESQTIARRLIDIENGRGLFTSKDLLVIDEAGMVATRQMQRLIAHAREQGAKVALVGDGQQLQPIEAGGPFRSIYERIGGAKMTEIRRQEKAWQKRCTQQLEGSEAAKALDTYNAKERIHEHGTQQQAAAAAVAAWRDFTAEHKEASSIILAYRNADVDRINEQARQAAKEMGRLKGRERAFETTKGERSFSKGDRVLFLKNNTAMGVKNGNLGMIERIRRNVIQVHLDNGNRLAFDARQYEHFTHGYAATVHKTQGATVDRTFALADPLFDRHSALTALTRHRNDVSLHWSTEQFKDFAALKQTLTRERPKELAIDFCAVRAIEPHPSHQIEEEHERERSARVDSRQDRTFGCEHGSDSRRRTPDHQPDAAASRGTDQAIPNGGPKPDRGMARSTQKDDQAMGVGGRGGGKLFPGGDSSDQGLDLEAMGPDLGRGVDRWCSSADRIHALAAPLLSRGQGAGRGDGALELVRGQVPQSKTSAERDIGQNPGLRMIDRTARAVKRQLKAMGCESYEVGIRDAKKDKMMHRTCSLQEVERAVPFLKRMNALGNDIYVRPAASEHGLVLVDDIDGVTVAEMREQGHAPALVVETSPKNLQAWVETGHELTDEHRAMIARNLAQTYGADMVSADGRYYGRLAGFTNQKPQHQDKYGRQPYCLLRHSSGETAREAPALVEKAHDKLVEQSYAKEKANRIEKIDGHRHGYEAVDAYKKQMQALHRRYGDKIDWSRADWMVSKDLAKRGYQADDIKQAIHEASPGLLERKKDHFEDYINRTVDKVMKDPEVHKALERQMYRGRGLSM